MEPRRGFSTRAIHGAKTPPVGQETPSVPIFQTSTFRFEDSEGYAETIGFRRPGYTYTRGYGNPTLEAFERVMAELEGTEGDDRRRVFLSWKIARGKKGFPSFLTSSL